MILQPYDMEVGAGTFHTATFLAAVGPGALARRLRAALAPPDRRPLRRQPLPPAALLPVPGGDQALAARDPRPVPRQPRARSGSTRCVHDVRFVEDNWESPDARRLGPRLGGVAERHGDHAVHLLPAGRRARLPPGDRRDHLRARAAGDVPAGRREHLRHPLERDARAAASPTATCSTRTRSSSRPTTSSTPTCAMLLRHFEDHERACQRAAGGEARAARLRAGAQGLAHLQPARCAARHLGHRAAALPAAGAHARQRRGARLSREPRSARLPAAETAARRPARACRGSRQTTA